MTFFSGGQIEEIDINSAQMMAATKMKSNTQRPKTTNQLRTIFGEARRRGLDNDTLHELVADVLISTGRGSSARCFGGGTAGSTRTGTVAADANATATRAVSIAALTYSQAEAVIERLKGRSFVPRRTMQHRRAKSGVVQLITDEQRELIAKLATQRNWKPETLQNFCIRQCGHLPLRTTDDANKVIEALKAMNRREGLWAA